MKAEGPKVVEENIGRALQDTGTGKDFLNRTPFAQELRQQSTNMTSFKLKKKKSVQQRKQLSEKRAHRESLPVEFLIKYQYSDIQRNQKTKNQANTEPNKKGAVSHRVIMLREGPTDYIIILNAMHGKLP